MSKTIVLLLFINLAAFAGCASSHVRDARLISPNELGECINVIRKSDGAFWAEDVNYGINPGEYFNAQITNGPPCFFLDGTYGLSLPGLSFADPDYQKIEDVPHVVLNPVGCVMSSKSGEEFRTRKYKWVKEYNQLVFAYYKKVSQTTPVNEDIK
jgi:hypothetical protein